MVLRSGAGSKSSAVDRRAHAAEGAGIKLIAVGWGQLQMDHYERVDAASSSLYKGYRVRHEVLGNRAEVIRTPRLVSRSWPVKLRAAGTWERTRRWEQL
jgi:hypothetical protein